MAEKYEYKVVGMYSIKKPRAELLTEFGQDGWRLVCIDHDEIYLERRSHITLVEKHEQSA